MLLIAITLLVAAAVALTRSAAFAFLNVYLPVLFLLPDYYRWVLPGLPDPTFGEAAVLPIAGMFILRELRGWRFSITDLLILGLAISMGYSEFINAGYSNGQNLMFDMLGTIAFPYMLAKGLIEPHDLRFPFARRVVILLASVSVIGLYEFRFGTTPWQTVLHRFFPGQGEGWVTTFRWGFARVAGPYGHAILAGLILVAGYRLQRWLEWSGAWAPRFKQFPGLPVSKARMLTVALLGGVVMTMVRGPWVGGVCGAVVTAIGRAKNRKRTLLLVLGAAFIFGIPVLAYLYSYASVGRAAAKSQAQETAAYRKELLDKYVAIVLQKGMWGWGRNGWPRVDGMPSIDNSYLLLALMHGLITLSFLVAVLISMPIRLVARALREPAPAFNGSSLGFTLAGIYVAMAITIGTVFMGTQVVPLFAILTGWSEGFLAPRELAPAPLFTFRRVVS